MTNTTHRRHPTGTTNTHTPPQTTPHTLTLYNCTKTIMFSWNTSLEHGDYSHEDLLAMERNERALAQQIKDMEKRHKLEIRQLKKEMKQYAAEVKDKASLKQKEADKKLFDVEKARRDDLYEHENQLKILKSEKDALAEDLKSIMQKRVTVEDKLKEMEQLFAKSKEDWEKQMKSLKESYMAATKKYDLEKSQWQVEKTKLENQLSGVIMVAQLNAHHTVSAAISNEAHRQRKRRREEITNSVD